MRATPEENLLREGASSPEAEHLCETVEIVADEACRKRGESNLLGTCDENALLLARQLDDSGFDATVVWGWSEGFEPPSPITNLGCVTEAVRACVVHVWVEVENPVSRYTAELASRVGDCSGEPAVFRGVPGEYRELYRHEPVEEMEEASRLLERYRTVKERQD